MPPTGILVVSDSVVVFTRESIMSESSIALLRVLAVGLFLGLGGYARGQDDGDGTGTMTGCCAGRSGNDSKLGTVLL